VGFILKNQGSIDSKQRAYKTLRLLERINIYLLLIFLVWIQMSFYTQPPSGIGGIIRIIGSIGSLVLLLLFLLLYFLRSAWLYLIMSLFYGYVVFCEFAQTLPNKMNFEFFLFSAYFAFYMIVFLVSFRLIRIQKTKNASAE